jgi:hypothetical protein
MPSTSARNPIMDLQSNLVPGEGLATAVLTVTATPVALSAGLPGRCRVTITPVGTILVGSSTISTLTGFVLPGGMSFSLQAQQAITVFGISPTGSPIQVGVLELS